MRKICVITGTRAEYGLLYWTIKSIDDDPTLKLQLCATGMHLSPEFGLTYRQIEEDGFRIDKKIEILLSSDTAVGISKSIGLAMIGFAEAFEELQPDIVLLLGDRYEILAAATAACMANIPIAHCHGGEITEGAFDDAIRHSITKMSHLHFVATDIYKKRVIQLGEQPHQVFHVGGLGVEHIYRTPLLNKEAFEVSIDWLLSKPTYLITFHPVTLEPKAAQQQFNALLEALDATDAQLLFTKPNSDPGGRLIIEMIDRYVEANNDRARAYTSLGYKRYLSALQHVAMVIGNSSSGLLEVPSFKIPTINIGDRQKGRVKGNTVVDCLPTSQDILIAINKAKKLDFKGLDYPNPYDIGSNPSVHILKVIKGVKLNKLHIKQFFDIPLS